MKFTRDSLGNYYSEDRRFKIERMSGVWFVTDLQEKEEWYRLNRLVGYKDKFLGYGNTLKEAKELCLKQNA
ncbi:MAG: hypothetical protein J6W84_06355 [Bacteroidales bacterium]|nr:hypothetical protein [Bacteroidales bacterium]